ncbi:MAG: hypothetical protein ACYDGY_03390 [Acidimicrobiales bacterium]
MSSSDTSGVPVVPPAPSALPGSPAPPGPAHGMHVKAEATQSGPARLTIEDIEGKLRSMTTRASSGVDDTRQRAGRYAVMAVAGLVIVAYLVGKRRGRLKSAVIEIKRG